MSEMLGLRFEFRVGLEMAVTAANAADRDVFAAKHSVPKGLVGAQSPRETYVSETAVSGRGDFWYNVARRPRLAHECKCG